MNLAEEFGFVPPAICAVTKNIEQLNSLWEKNYKSLSLIGEREGSIASNVIDKGDSLIGYSETARKEVEFILDQTKGSSINWRESLLCPVTNLNNRSRASATILLRNCNLLPSSDVYITEQTTPMYSWIKAIAPETIGSEYVGFERSGGAIVNGIRHEDLTKLSFEDSSFDIVSSFDCLEHIPEYPKAIKEVHRVLKPGGQVLMTFPFNAKHQTTTRAVVNEFGDVTHLLEPEYHGDPVNPEHGVLCYYHFGFDILSIFYSIGFRDAYILWHWSGATGNLGGLQPYIIAIK